MPEEKYTPHKTLRTAKKAVGNNEGGYGQDCRIRYNAYARKQYANGKDPIPFEAWAKINCTATKA